MTYEQLQEVNGVIKTTDVKGKQYAEVPQRINAFRKLYPNGSISTAIIKLEDGLCVMRATVSDEDGKVLGTGTAYEKENSSFINKTSYIENCETSAVGRALAMCGIGIDVSIASAEEVENAVLNQEMSEKATTAQINTLKKLFAKNNVDFAEYLSKQGLTEETLTKGIASKWLSKYANGEK